MNKNAAAMLVGAVLGMATGPDPSNPSPSRHDREPKRRMTRTGAREKARRARQIANGTLAPIVTPEEHDHDKA